MINLVPAESKTSERRTFGNVAAIARPSRLLAVRCPDGQFTLIHFNEEWVPCIGEPVEGELNRLGRRQICIGNGTPVHIEVRSFNCSAQFARDRLTET